ncbi:MAG: IucA/IucC family siderophore biosynthesis protein [Rubrobacter sp.]|nr:IucA/IucC family siderophore biosynthesis protein [Rubrobacter sp.]
MSEMTEHAKTLDSALRPDIWKECGRSLLSKMLSEYMFEEIILPEAASENGGLVSYRLPLTGGVEYRFEARRRLFDSYRVEGQSIVRQENGESAPSTDPQRFILDARETMGLSAETAGHFVRELGNTLLADAHIAMRKESGGDLADMGYAELEGEMEGHPWIAFNKGRLGFGYDDYLAHAPEMKRRARLSWVAVSREHAHFSAVSDMDYEKLVSGELDADTRSRFEQTLWEKGQDPAGYYLLPVHDWQWKNAIVPHFAGEIAAGNIVPLGQAPDEYLPQQSIRTFFNVSDESKHSVKVPLSILNTLVWRGLPAERTQVAPRVTEWIKGICDNDPFLRDECRLALPGEVAGLNYDHPYHSRLAGTPYQYLEMLGAIWRESILRYADPGEEPVTLAALLHVDGRDRAYVSGLMERAGMETDEWVGKLFDAVLPPLLHYLYKYGTVFSPHGENAILMLKDHAPSRLAMKDFVDDVNISDQPLPELQNIPDDLRPVLLEEPPEGLCQFIQAGLFICHLRYLSDLLEERHGYSERDFWAHARRAVLEYQERFPELQDRFETFQMLAPSFTKLCLNRNRMFDYGYADDEERPHAAEFGRVANALQEVETPASF